MNEQKDPKTPTGPLFKGEEHSAPYPVSRLAPAFGLVELAREIAEADERIAARADAQLQVIAEQVKALQAEAQRILHQARLDQQLNHVRCAFSRVPGHVYHLYRRRDGELEFSMLSPADWRGKPPSEYVNSYRLGIDMRWKAAEELAGKEDTLETVSQLLQGLEQPL